ncbi:hypothetical protein ACWEOO_38885 [Kribbella sp. NPDC004138]
MMGYPCVRLADRFLASYDATNGLVVKLPARRVSELIRAGTGVPFAPAGKVFREWIAVPTINPELWHELLDEAVIFARASLNA